MNQHNNNSNYNNILSNNYQLKYWLDPPRPDSIGVKTMHHIIYASSKFAGNTWDDSTTDLGNGFFRFNIKYKDADNQQLISTSLYRL